MAISIQKFIACDDVRMEITNKAILIGVYTGDVIQVPQFPIPVYLSIYMEIISDVTGDFTGFFGFQGPNMLPGGIIQGHMRFHFAQTPTPIYLRYLNFTAQGPGEYWLTWQLPSQSPEKLHSLRVIEQWKPPS